VYDLLGVLFLVGTVPDCYSALGVVHNLWAPIPGQFDDYIARPKSNMYQSLHTAVIALDGQRLEVQIRTHEMHRVAEFGIAAHWRYKESQPRSERQDAAFETKLAWLRQLLIWQQELTSAQEFVESVKTDIFRDQVFVFTPKGEVKELPAGSTPLDFAYQIHTEVGHRCIGAKVNNRLVPLDYELRSGEVVEILTSKAARAPSRDWLNIVRTTHAREKIKQWFKRQQREENIARGKEVLDTALRRLGLGSLASLEGPRLEQVAEQLKHPSVDALFAALGYGGVGAQTVLGKLGLRDSAAVPVPVFPAAEPAHAPSGSSVSVMGVGNLLTRMATCCKPVPGDEVSGYITRGRGITVHRSDCKNLASRAQHEPERLTPVEWGPSARSLYPVTLRIESWDRQGLQRDVSTVVADEGLNITNSHTSTSPTRGTATFLITVELSSLQQLSRLMARLETVRSVFSVSRDLRGTGLGQARHSAHPA